jgi:hypothetical protein
MANPPKGGDAKLRGYGSTGATPVELPTFLFDAEE